MRRRREAEHDEECWRRHHGCAVELLESYGTTLGAVVAPWEAVRYWRRQALDARRVIRDQADYIRYLERELVGRPARGQGRSRLPRGLEVTE